MSPPPPHSIAVEIPTQILDFQTVHQTNCTSNSWQQQKKDWIFHLVMEWVNDFHVAIFHFKEKWQYPIKFLKNQSNATGERGKIPQRN